MNLEQEVRKIADILGEDRIRNTLKNLSAIEANKCLFKIRKVKEKISVFEKRYQMSSEKAWEEFSKGMMGDDSDVMTWMAFYENLLDFQDEYNRVRKMS